ncbi:MAG: 2'-5' RNA ligase family protein [Firmicutes bacterium]|nr:2'-5' RNA ligase family protein [Bacillota bacterium]
MVDSALVIPVGLPTRLERLRRTYDSDALWLPAHITVLLPFAPAAEKEAVTPRLAAALAAAQPFEAVVSGVGTFASAERVVVYLRLASRNRLEALFAAVHQSFPDYPPYAGLHDSVVPHITVARVAPRAAASVISLVRQALRASAPVVVPVRSVEWLIPALERRCRTVVRLALPLRAAKPAMDPEA